jgi:uncharacterized protein YccT (UPF0319 family)
MRHSSLTIAAGVAFLCAGLLLSGCRTSSRTVGLGQDEVLKGHVVRLVVPHTVRVLTVDGVKLEFDVMPLGAREQTYELSPGEHRLLARYSEIWPVGSDDHERVDSRVVELTVAGAAGESFRVVHTRPANLVAAREYAEHPDLSVERVSGDDAPPSSSVGASVGMSPQAAPVEKPGEVPPDATADVSQPASATPVPAGAVPAAEVEVAPSAMLKYWWGRASEAERAAFTAWTEGGAR